MYIYVITVVCNKRAFYDWFLEPVGVQLLDLSSRLLRTTRWSLACHWWYVYHSLGIIAPHWDLARCWRSAANSLAFTGLTIQSHMVQRFCSGKAERMCPLILSAAERLLSDIRKRQSEVTDEFNEACLECFPLRATRVFWIVCCQGVSNDMMVAVWPYRERSLKEKNLFSFSKPVNRWQAALRALAKCLKM